jgi:hypothetical protein
MKQEYNTFEVASFTYMNESDSPQLKFDKNHLTT